MACITVAMLFKTYYVLTRCSSNWMNNFIVAFVVPPMIKGIKWGMYLFFGVWLALGAVFVWFFVPETKNKTLEEMDMVFGSITAQKDQDSLAAIREEVGLTQLLRGDGGVTPVESELVGEKGTSNGFMETV